MAPSTNVEPRANSDQSGTNIGIAVLVSVGGAIVLSFLVVIILLIRKRKRDEADEIYIGKAAPPLRTHRLNLSDASGKPLLVEEFKGDWDYQDKFSPPPRRPTDEVTRENRDILSNNPNGLYHIPSAHTLNHATLSPAPSSGCLTHGFDMKTVSDHHAPSERPPLPPLPPLAIPEYPYSRAWQPAAASEESSPPQPLSRSASTISHYSQRTAESPPTTPSSYFIPLSQELAHAQEAPPDEEELHRGDTHLVGTLLKARAQRNPDGLTRTSSQVSHIERSGSIKSVAPIHHDDRPYARRYKSKKRKGTYQVGEMEVLQEASEGGSLRSRSDSTATSHWDPSLFIQVPPRAVSGPLSPPLRRA